MGVIMGTDKSEKRNLSLRNLILVVATILWTVPPALAETKSPVRIAVLPIVVHSADDPEYLRDGLADMLASRLDQVGGFEVIRVEDESKGTTRLERAVKTGAKAGAEYVLFGSFTRFGTGASLDMQCSSTQAGDDGPTLREIFVHSGSIGEVIPDLDDLIGKVGRFAISGFASKRAGGGADVAAAPPSAANTELDELRARVELLEETVQGLQVTAPDPAPANGD